MGVHVGSGSRGTSVGRGNLRWSLLENVESYSSQHAQGAHGEVDLPRYLPYGECVQSSAYHGVDDVALEEGNFHLVAGSTGVSVVKHADDYCRKSH